MDLLDKAREFRATLTPVRQGGGASQAKIDYWVEVGRELRMVRLRRDAIGRPQAMTWLECADWIQREDLEAAEKYKRASLASLLSRRDRMLSGRTRVSRQTRKNNSQVSRDLALT